MNKITFVTGNKAKARDVQRILKFPLIIKDIDLEEIQEVDIEKVAIHKLTEAFKKIKAPVIIDDVGLYIKAWNNFPGPLIKWVLKASGGDAKLLLKLMEGQVSREATARVAIGYHDGKKIHIFWGEDQGSIAKEIRGENGFGWDAVFVPDGEHETYAEMPFKKKDQISHRRKALDKFKEFLDSQSK